MCKFIYFFNTKNRRKTFESLFIIVVKKIYVTKLYVCQKITKKTQKKRIKLKSHGIASILS